MTNARQTDEAIPCPACDKTSTPAGTEVVYAEPLTHCEWCGAEYPQPDDAPVAGTSTRGSAAKDG